MNEPADTGRLSIRPATAAERPAAIELCGAPADSLQPSQGWGLWVACQGSRLVGAMRVQVQAGRTATLFPPRTVPGAAFAAPVLLEQVLAQLPRDKLPRNDVQLVLALVEDDHGPEAELLLACDFQHAANVVCMVSSREDFPDVPPASFLQFIPVVPDERKRLARIVERTYVDSRDCPAIDRLRSVDDVLAGYQASGTFDPNYWLIATSGSVDVGCLLLTLDARHRPCELTYMGIVPDARRRGYGLALARHAQWLARAAGSERLTLVVDEANAPAAAMYAAAGFVSWNQRGVFFRCL